MHARRDRRLREYLLSTSSTLPYFLFLPYHNSLLSDFLQPDPKSKTTQPKPNQSKSKTLIKMGAVVSCITGMFRAIGSGLMAIVNGIASMLQGIVGAIASFFNILISCLTCGRSGRRGGGGRRTRGTASHV
ncbi:hypothetical protein PVAG01_06461 [Phlyctema vagabunda]|uniref:Uncharacterized protein n=1 Tax=Phlyctema vagabunda TaxID=108571 RepID=A0ABR4PG70_9HELO